jgi:hypothetical protein
MTLCNLASLGLGAPSKDPIRCVSTRRIVLEKTHQSVSMVNENVLGLLHGDGVINMQGTVLGPFP